MQNNRQHRKIATRITSLVLVITLIGTLIYYSNTITDPESSREEWTTYTNNELGFQFTYPQEWAQFTPEFVSGITGKSFSGTFKQKLHGPFLSAETSDFTHEGGGSITEPWIEFLKTGKGVTSPPDQTIDLGENKAMFIWTQYTDYSYVTPPESTPNVYMGAIAPLDHEEFSWIAFGWNYSNPEGSRLDKLPPQGQQKKFIEMVKSFKYVN